MHGQADFTVPAYTMEPYYNQLATRGIAYKIVDPYAGHEWIDAAPYQILNWFLGHPCKTGCPPRA
jgi:predicted esterase